MMRRSLLRLATLLVAATPLAAQAPAAAPTSAPIPAAAPDPARLEHRLRPAVRLAGRADTAFSLLERMRHYHVPGVSIAVVDGNRVVFARGYGVTEFGGSTPVDTTTLFLAGSISKPVFATGALALVEQGVLALDEDVNARLTSWKVPASPHTATEKVTLRRLLTHSAGLTVWGFPGYRMGAPLPTVPQILDGAPPANTAPVRNDTTPGARWLYSGGGITVAQLLATDVTGEPFPALMRRLVLDRVGMARSTFENPLPEARWREAATGHERLDTPVPGRFHVYPEMAAAGLWTTAADLARWAAALSRAYGGETGGVLSPAMARQMVSAQVRQQPPYGTGAWGLGIGVGGAADSVFFTHGGRDEGFVATLTLWPERGRGIVVLTNGVSGGLLAEIVRAFREEYGLPGAPRAEKRVAVLEPAALAAFAGVYRTVAGRDTVQIRVEAAGEGLLMHDPILGHAMRLLPEGPDRFFDLATGAPWRVEREGSAVRALIVGTGPGARRVWRE